jgi:transposase-like protein
MATSSVSAFDVSPEERYRLVTEFQASGLCLREFAQPRGLATSSFHRWVRKVEAGWRPSDSKPPRARMERQLEGLLAEVEVVPQQMQRAASPVVVRLPAGVRIEFPAELVERVLRRLLMSGAPC